MQANGKPKPDPNEKSHRRRDCGVASAQSRRAILHFPCQSVVCHSDCSVRTLKGYLNRAPLRSPSAPGKQSATASPAAATAKPTMSSTIALHCAHRDTQTSVYLDRRISEGKAACEAVRSLKRHLSSRLNEQLIR
jgi:hypothetical protein